MCVMQNPSSFYTGVVQSHSSSCALVLCIMPTNFTAGAHNVSDSRPVFGSANNVIKRYGDVQRHDNSHGVNVHSASL